MAILAYPLIDTLRVFTIRARKGISPFAADQNHIHHRLLSNGCSHKKAVGILYSYTLSVILVALFVTFSNTTITFFVTLFFAIIFIIILFFIKVKKK